MNKESNLITLTGLWEKVDKNGSIYFSGTLGGSKIMVFQNKTKEPGSNKPDFFICLGKNDFKKKDEDSNSLEQVVIPQ